MKEMNKSSGQIQQTFICQKLIQWLLVNVLSTVDFCEFCCTEMIPQVLYHERVN